MDDTRATITPAPDDDEGVAILAALATHLAAQRRPIPPTDAHHLPLGARRTPREPGTRTLPPPSPGHRLGTRRKA